MNMFNSCIYQNQRPSLTEVLGELLPVYNLDLYEELGNNALKCENNCEAINWFTKGFSMARELRNKEKIELFKVLILKSL